ncbi:MAG TPA: hypothetical protein VNJ51_07370 [Candidatus Dormibacteraeota bacterium]|nr:hypothetical protein [Candidatus Dormibacteraeota bacterium]
MFKRFVLVVAALALMVVPSVRAEAVNLLEGGSVPVPLKVAVTQVPGAPVELGAVTATRDSDGNLDVTAAYRNTGRHQITAVRIRFEVYDPFGGQLGYFNGVSQDPLPALKSVTMDWGGDEPYPIAGSVRARVTDVAFADGTYWQAPDVPNPVVAAEHRRLLKIYRDGGLPALLKALGE